MVSDIVFIADFFADQVLGGGELNNEVFINHCVKLNYNIQKINSNKVSIDFIRSNSNCFFIVANFVGLKKECMDFLTEKCTYVIYEHDHKYLKSRDPAIYTDFLAPKEEIINYDFYKQAINVFCQSSFHQSIVEKNTGLSNVVNLSGNLWDDASLGVMRTISKKPKQDIYAIMNSPIPHKNTRECVEYCEIKGLRYILVSSSNYFEFLSSLGNNKKLLFLPKTPETLSRVVVEARMMGIAVTTNKLVGAAYEPWFALKGEEMIEEAFVMKKRIPELILSCLKDRGTNV